MNPCGLADAEMTSLSAEAGRPVSVADAAQAFTRHFARALDCELVPATGAAAG